MQVQMGRSGVSQQCKLHTESEARVSRRKYWRQSYLLDFCLFSSRTLISSHRKTKMSFPFPCCHSKSWNILSQLCRNGRSNILYMLNGVASFQFVLPSILANLSFFHLYIQDGRPWAYGRPWVSLQSYRVPQDILVQIHRLLSSICVAFFKFKHLARS